MLAVCHSEGGVAKGHKELELLKMSEGDIHNTTQTVATLKYADAEAKRQASVDKS